MPCRSPTPLPVESLNLPSSPAQNSEPSNWVSSIRKELDNYALGQILFNPPKDMRVGRFERIEVRITQKLDIDLAKNLKGKGIPETIFEKVAPFMRVKLSGDDFEIKALNEEGQIVPDDGFTEWAWDVLPLKSGFGINLWPFGIRIFFNPISDPISIFPIKPPIGLIMPPELIIPVIATSISFSRFSKAAMVNTAIEPEADGPPTIEESDLIVYIKS